MEAPGPGRVEGVTAHVLREWQWRIHVFREYLPTFSLGIRRHFSTFYVGKESIHGAFGVGIVQNMFNKIASFHHSLREIF